MTFQRVLHTLAATQEVPQHTCLHWRESTRVPPTSRGAPFPPTSPRGGILSLRGRERIPGIPVASQEKALSTGMSRGTPGSCHKPRVPQMSQSILGKPFFPALPRLSTGPKGTRSGGLRKGQSPCELLGGLSGFLSRRCRGLRRVESEPEPEDSSPVLTWILGNFFSLPREVSPRL